MKVKLIKNFYETRPNFKTGKGEIGTGFSCERIIDIPHPPTPKLSVFFKGGCELINRVEYDTDKKEYSCYAEDGRLYHENKESVLDMYIEEYKNKGWTITSICKV